MSKEAMKLALEALEDTLSDDPYPYSLESKAITALREALAEQPAQQEPVAWKLVPTEPTEEMLKAMDECSKEGYDERLYAGHAASVYMAAVDAAPTPPAQRTWVGLTDEEIQTIWRSSEHMNEAEVCRAIEAKLKEKNNA